MDYEHLGKINRIRVIANQRIQSVNESELNKLI
jgi:hypothetical protein